MAKKPKDPRTANGVDKEIGDIIRLRRTEIKMSQMELAHQSGGISFQQIQKYEKGINRVGAARLQQIAIALDVPVTFFYEKRDKKHVEVDSLLNIDPRFTIRVLRAYTNIKDRGVQHRIVALMESIAGEDGAA